MINNAAIFIILGLVSYQIGEALASRQSALFQVLFTVTFYAFVGIIALSAILLK